jgi:hypothetical protein
VSTKAILFTVENNLQKGLALQCLLWTQWPHAKEAQRSKMRNDEVRKSVHYRLPLFSREKLRRLSEKRVTSMTGILIELIERAKL